MEAIIDRLRELEAEEVQMLKDHKALLVKRTQEDERRVRERAEEDEAWQSQLLNRDREEDASRVFSCSIQADVLTKNCQTLRQQRRELSRASLTEVLPVASSAVYQDAKTEETFMFGPTNDTASTVITPKFEGSTTMKKTNKPRAKQTKPRARKPKNVMEGWISHDSQGRSLYIRPSDGQLVYLECCFPGCRKTNFKNISSIRRHVSDTRGHNVEKGFFINHAHVIEVCGKVPPKRQALGAGEEEHRLIEPYPHQEQIAYEPEPSTPVSSLRQSARTHAIEQDFDGLNSRTHDCLSAKEIERVAFPEYFSSMSYDTDDDDVDTTVHAASQHRATVRQRYLPELASLDAGQMGSLVKTLLEVQIKREAESIDFAVEANDTPKIWTVLTQQIDAVENLTLVGEPEVETELAHTSILLGNRFPRGDKNIDDELPDKPVTANDVAAEIQEANGPIGGTTDLGDTVADSHQPSEGQLTAVRATDSELSKGVSHKRSPSITLALLDTAAQKRRRYDSYTFGPSSS